jgi:hypothetical protein
MRFFGWLFGSIAGLIVAILIIAGLSVGGLYLFGTISNKTANFRGNVGVKNQTLADPNYRIANYDHFFDLCASVQTMETRISTARDNLASDQKGSFDAYRDRQNLDAAIAQRAELINQYNADSAKSYTQAQMKASSLPARLDIHARETQCTL